MDLAGGNLYVPLKVGFARMGGVVQLLKQFFSFYEEFDHQRAANSTVAGA